jgi:hypothetical protein
VVRNTTKHLGRQLVTLTTTVPTETTPCYSVDPGERRELSLLFDSTNLIDHKAASSLCGDCPFMAGCLSVAQGIAGDRDLAWAGAPNGTWGGELWRGGRRITRKGDQ